MVLRPYLNNSLLLLLGTLRNEIEFLDGVSGRGDKDSKKPASPRPNIEVLRYISLLYYIYKIDLYVVLIKEKVIDLLAIKLFNSFLLSF